MCNRGSSLKSLQKAVTSTSGVGSEVSRTGGWEGKMDMKGGESNDVCDQQQLAPFAMELHTLDQEETEWELELPQPCNQGKDNV